MKTQNKELIKAKKNLIHLLESLFMKNIEDYKEGSKLINLIEMERKNVLL